MDNNITVFSAFFAGVISFLSPCVLPLVPAYLSFLAGVSLEEIQQNKQKGLQTRVFMAALIFVLGFSTVFVLLGASATMIGKWLLLYSKWLERLAGILLIVLGMHLSGIIRIPVLFFEKRFHFQKHKLGWVGVFFIGAAFAFGWSPCVGPLLAGILALASAQNTVWQGMMLLAVYSAGLGLPFLLAALAVERFLNWSRRFQHYLRWIEIIAGILLMLIGGVMLFGYMLRLSSVFSVFGRFGL